MTKNQKLLIPGIAVALVAAGAVIYQLIPKPMPDPEKITSTEALDYALSDDFANLPLEKKQEYMRKSMKNRKPGDRGDFRNLTEAERRKLRKNMEPLFRARMKEEIDKYFTLSEEEKVAFLDKKIDEMEARRKEHGEGPPEGPPPEEDSKDGDSKGGKGGRHHGPPSAKEMKKHIEGSSAEERAKVSEFMRAMRARHEQRKGK